MIRKRPDYSNSSHALVVGSETHGLRRKDFVSGIERVVSETHRGLVDLIGASGGQVVQVNTSPEDGSLEFLNNSYLASDPVLSGPQKSLEDIDVLINLDLATTTSFIEIAKERRKRSLPVVSVVHDVLPLTNPEWFMPEVQFGFRLFIQQMLFTSDVIVVTSSEVRSNLEALEWKFDGIVVTLPLGSTHAQREPAVLPPSQISAMYVSTVAPRKGHSRLLDAFDLLREGGHDVDLTLVGKAGWLSDDLFARIQNHPDFGGRLRWLTNADDAEVKALAARCNVGVIPADGEGFGMFLEEALTLGLKVVASNIPVFTERAQDNVFFSELTPKSLAATLIEASETPWAEPSGTGVRTMKDFATDLSRVIQDTYARSKSEPAGNKGSRGSGLRSQPS